MSSNAQSSGAEDDNGRRRLIALALIGFSLLPIGWGAYAIYVLGTGTGFVLFPLLLGIGHLLVGIYLLYNTAGSAADSVEQELDDDFEP